ncbi:PD-(D/E)XK nuclease family protein [Lacinutrix undariae]
MNLEQLQTFLNQNEIPKIKGKPKTFLGIAKQPHYENVLSNMYAFYFNVTEEHNLKDLFIVALQELIAEKLKAINLIKEITFTDAFDIETEYTTLKKGRIDLLLSNDEQAIIIENKVYHHLDNDLFDYWKTVKVPDKVGIVLSLHPISDIKHPNFINITHLELLNSVMDKLGNYLLEANDKYLVFLKDLYQNITNLSKSFMEKKDLEFYFKNQVKINEIAKLKYSVRGHIIEELEKVGNSIEDVDLYLPRKSSNAGKRYCFYKSKIDSNLMITIVYGDLLLKDKKMWIIVEFKDGALKDKSQYNIVEFTPEEKVLLVEGFESNKSNSWAHFAVKHYNLTQDDIINLSDFVNKALENDHLLSIYRKLNAYMYDMKESKKLAVK